MARRDGFDIVADILIAVRDAGGKLKPTHVMYKANLSYPQLKRFLEELKVKGLVELADEVVITGKGYDFIEQYLKAKAFEESFGLEV